MNRTNKTSIKNKVNKSSGSAGDIALKRSSSTLIKAIRQADDVKVRQLLESGVNPNARDNLYQGNDALHYAVNGRSLSILKMLLEHNCYHSDVNYDKESAFEIALKLSKFEFAEALLCFGARVEINLFKDYYAPVDSERRKLALLFFWFADLDARDSNGLAILHLGCVREDIEGISILIRRGAKINQRTRGLGITPLHIAAKTLSVPCVTMLLRLGADLELRDEYGHTPLHHAVVHYHQAADSKKRLEVLELLLKAGCQVNKRSNANISPLHVAARFAAYECIQLLLKYGADVNARDYLGRTPMFVLIGGATGCIDEERLETVQLMISAGANVTLADNNGVRPQHLLSECAFE